MGKIDLEIIFESPSGVFYASQQIAGRVKLVLSESTKLKAIKLKLSGEAAVRFTENSSGKKEHRDKVVYFEHADVLLGSADSSVLGSSTVTLPAGPHEFPFAFDPPSDLPSSFESKMGYVRYTAKAYCQRSWKFDETVKRGFSVVGIVDLNQEPKAFTPGSAEAERRYKLADRLFSCLGGGISARLHLDRTAFVPGEQILVNAEIENKCTEKVEKVEAYLQQNVIYTAKSGKRFERGDKKIGVLSQGAVNPGKVQIWHHEPLTVPSLPPSRLAGCKLICIDYLLTLCLYVRSRKPILLYVPVVIGTVPLHLVPEQRTEPPPSSPPPVQPSAPVFDGPPPSYQECVYTEMGEPDEENDNTYQPLYPTYAISGRQPPDSFTLNLL